MARRNLPPLNALLAFDAAARYGNFTRAAAELGVAQPAVTRHVANLEDWLGVRLFERTGNSVWLSRHGAEVSQLATTVFDRLELELGRTVAEGRAEIVIGASFGMTHLWLMPQITSLRGAAYGASINFLTSEHYRDFDNQRVNLSIRFGSGDWPGWRADLLFAETTYVIASPDFLARHRGIDPDNLAGTLEPDWLLEHGDPGGYGWMTWPRWYDRQNRVPPQQLTRADVTNYPTLLDMVRCGEGVALGFAGLNDGLIASGGAVRIGPPLSRPELGYYLLSEPDGRRSRTAEDLRRYLVDTVQK
ncbi:MAG: LysR family transcriptional regulator [Pseudomonadota bacterium]